MGQAGAGIPVPGIPWPGDQTTRSQGRPPVLTKETDQLPDELVAQVQQGWAGQVHDLAASLLPFQ